ncbi:hypothetical protein BRD03_00990 [Halobacteriales archaeon QS_9_68_17]|nr:MAG: hypothetical protein BRD03_00990 [Halobacteriales archaeon QS_9_68_17]
MDAGVLPHLLIALRYPLVMASETGIALAAAIAASVPALSAVRLYDRRSAVIVGSTVLGGDAVVLLNMPPVLPS